VLNKKWLITLLVFLLYVSSLGVLLYYSVGLHMAHGDSYNHAYAPIPPSLAIIDFLLTIMGFPVHFIFALIAKKYSLSFSFIDYSLLYILNGFIFSYLFSYILFFYKKKSKAFEDINSIK
jgi:hypothetical protein